MDVKPTEPLPNYDDAVRWIYERIDYERVPPVRTSPHFQLDRVRRQLQLIGSPEQRIRCVHIAGTKGKGSTAAILDSILRASDVRTGLFTSPHLTHFEERMRVNGRPPNPGDLTQMVNDLRTVLAEADEDLQSSPPTYFEVATLLAWMYFDRSDVDLVVLETGLGGRLDCTNVCTPLVTVITNISLDHTSILGNTLEQIASEKAGILKPHIPLVTGVTQPEVIGVCETAADRLKVPITRLHEQVHVQLGSATREDQTVTITTPSHVHRGVVVPLAGRHQAENAALAVAAADLVSESFSKVTPQTIRCGLANTEWPLRFEIVSERPLVILDGAHNPDAAAAVAETLDEPHWTERPRVLLFAASQDKDVEQILAHLVPLFEHVVVTRYEDNPRSCDPVELQAVVSQLTEAVIAQVAVNPREALQLAQSLATPDGLILVTGSVFIGAQCRLLLVAE